MKSPEKRGKTHPSGFLEPLQLILLQLNLVDVAADMGVAAQQDGIQLLQPVPRPPRVLLVGVDVGHLLQGEPLQRQPMSAHLTTTPALVDLPAQLGDLGTVVQLEVTAQSVFHRHGQHVAQLFTFTHKFALDVACGCWKHV